MTTWILATNKPDKIVGSLQRRMTKLRLAPLNGRMKEYLAKLAVTHSLSFDVEALADRLSAASITSPGLAAQALEKHLAGSTIEESVNSAADPLNSREVCRALLNGKWDPIRQALDSYTSEEIRSLRYMMLSWLRRTVVGGSAPRARQAAEMIQMLTDGAPTEDPALIPWISCRLFLLCNHPKTASSLRAV